MPIVEYESGAAFPGVIGRTAEESSPAWPAPVRAAGGAPNVLFIVLDDTGFGQLGCYGSPIATPNLDGIAEERAAVQQHAHDGALLAEPLVHRHGPQPPRQRDGLHHGARLGLPGLQRRHPVRERVPLGDAGGAGLQHVHGRQVASDAEQPGDRGRAVRSLAARPGLPALLRLPRGRHEPVVSGARPRQPPGRAAEEARGGLPPERGPGRQGRLASSPTASRPTRRSPSICTCASAPRMPRTTWRRSGPTSTRACSTTAGTPTGRRPSRGRRSWGSSPPTRSCHATTRMSRTGTRSRRPAKQLYARMMEVFAGFLEHTDHQIGRLLDFLREAWASSTTR